MSRRVEAAMDAVRIVAERRDPRAAIAVGTIAARLGMSLSRASRLCADVEHTGLLERAEDYGSYRLGARAVRLSGRAAAPYAQTVRLALTRASQQTGETACLAARSGPRMRVVAAVESAWTLYAPAEVGEPVDDPRSAVLRADQAVVGRAEPRTFESTIGMRAEIAAPVRGATGETVAVVVVRLPSNRLRSGAARARRAVEAARRQIEAALADPRPFGDLGAAFADPGPVGDRTDTAASVTSIEGAARVIEHLAAGRSSIAEISRALGFRVDRTQRLVDACAALLDRSDGTDVGLGWAVHAWHRAATESSLTGECAELVVRTARRTGQCSFLTVLRGMRSLTVVEVLEGPGEGLALTPWLGRPCRIVHADGGPTLLMDFEIDEIPPLLPDALENEAAELLERVRTVSQNGVLSKGSAEEAGQIAVSAPVRDASGLVVAAACIVGATETIRPRLTELEAAVLRLADAVSTQLGRPVEPTGRLATPAA
ncbi:hypothetical protein [Cryptosporangium sp. NPDC048952]|uniref:hypothetical protein n=1 Tax=Cryptosporangium sp. NPDC048952 TaxID=3363961 RepID=UPI003723925A